MPRQMSPERQKEYADLNAYIDCFATHVQGIDPDDPVHPTNAGKQIVADYGKSAALQGLRLNTLMREQGIVTFSEVCRRYSRLYKRVLKNGTIKSETEFHLIAGILADASPKPDSDERAKLEQLVAEFEVDA